MATVTTSKLKTKTPQTYAQLRTAVRETIARGKVRARQAVDREKVRTAWEVGKLVLDYVLLNERRADYGARIIQRLSKDIHTSETDLKYMIEFARSYPIRPTSGELAWSHYRELLSVNAPEKRKALAAEAAMKSWTISQLRVKIKEIKGLAGQKIKDDDYFKTTVPAKPGKTGIYRIFQAKAGPWAGKAVIDLGFSAYFRPPKGFKFEAGDIVEWKHKRLQKIGAAPAGTSAGTAAHDLFTYRAWQTHIIDGDTFWVTVDLGFGITMHQKLRLRGIDAPEIESRSGQEAKGHLTKILNRQSVMTIRSLKSDKYDRYLADIFVGEHYLNAEMVESGFAVRQPS